MGYPESYVPAEHRRALDAMIADIADHPRTEATSSSDRAPTRKHLPVLARSSAPGVCAVLIRVEGAAASVAVAG